MSKDKTRLVAPEIPHGVGAGELTVEVMDDQVVAYIDGKVVGVAFADGDAQDISRSKILELPIGDHLETLALIAQAHEVQLVR